MEVKIKDGNGYIEAEWTIEDGVMVVSPKVEKFEPKDGDVLNIDESIIIVKNVRNSVSISFDVYVALCGDILHFNKMVACSNFKPATEEEKQKLFDKLKEEGFEWDSEKKELVKCRWKPKEREKYFYPLYSVFSSSFNPKSPIWEGTDAEECLFEKGWIFKTESECQALCDKLNNAIKEVKL